MQPSSQDAAPTASASYAAQDSPLLNLPPEIRNMIYEFARCNIDKAQVKILHKSRKSGSRNILTNPQAALVDKWHALALTCRQVRAEINSFVAAADPQTDRDLEWHVKNFQLRTVDDAYAMEEFLYQLPRLPDGRKRTLVKRVTLDNNFTFDPYDCDLRLHCHLDRAIEPEEERSVGIRTSIHLDPSSFEIWRLGEFLRSWQFNRSGLLYRLRSPMLQALDDYSQIKAAERSAKVDARRAHVRGQGEDLNTALALPSIKRIMCR